MRGLFFSKRPRRALDRGLDGRRRPADGRRRPAGAAYPAHASGR